MTDSDLTARAPAGPASQAGRRGALLFVVLGALMAIGPFSIDTYLPAFPSISRQLHASPSAVQLTLTACLLGIAVGQLVIGPLSDRWGRRPPLIVGMAGFAVASALCGLAPNIWLLVAARAAQGITGSAGIVIANAVVGDMHRGRGAAHYFSRLWLIGGMAPVVAPLVGGAVLHFTTWRVVFVLLAAGGALLTVAAAIAVPETNPPERRAGGSLAHSFRLLGSLVRRRVFMGYVLTGGFAFGALFAYLSGSSFVYQDVLGVSATVFAVIFGINSAGQLLASQVNGHLVRSHEPRRLLWLGLVLCLSAGATLLVVALTGTTAFLAFAIPLFVLVAGLGFAIPNVPALALAQAPRHAGSAAALLGVTQFAIGAAVAPLVGLAGSTHRVAHGGGRHRRPVDRCAVHGAAGRAARAPRGRAAETLKRRGRQPFGHRPRPEATTACPHRSTPPRPCARWGAGPSPARPVTRRSDTRPCCRREELTWSPLAWCALPSLSASGARPARRHGHGTSVGPRCGTGAKSGAAGRRSSVRPQRYARHPNAAAGAPAPGPRHRAAAGRRARTAGRCNLRPVCHRRRRSARDLSTIATGGQRHRALVNRHRRRRARLGRATAAGAGRLGAPGHARLPSGAGAAPGRRGRGRPPAGFPGAGAGHLRPRRLGGRASAAAVTHRRALRRARRHRLAAAGDGRPGPTAQYTSEMNVCEPMGGRT